MLSSSANRLTPVNTLVLDNCIKSDMPVSDDGMYIAQLSERYIVTLRCIAM
jgi:hypothetical protein